MTIRARYNVKIETTGSASTTVPELSQDLRVDTINVHLINNKLSIVCAQRHPSPLYDIRLWLALFIRYEKDTEYMMSEARFERDHEDEHEHEQDATSTIDHGPSHHGISNIISNPLTDTTTTLSEGPRPEIYTSSQDARKSTDKRPEDSWNSNTLTLNNHTQSSQTQTRAFKKLSTTTQAAIDRQNGIDHDWEETWEKERLAKWREKVEVDLKGWRGGNGLVLFAFLLLV